MTCPKKIRAWAKDDGIFACRLPVDHGGAHVATGLFEHQTIHWQDGDRRQFAGVFHPCDESSCCLPAGHHGNHAS